MATFISRREDGYYYEDQCSQGKKILVPSWLLMFLGQRLVNTIFCINGAKWCGKQFAAWKRSNLIMNA